MIRIDEFDKCAECHMLVTANEYHPYAACVLYKQLGQADKVKSCLDSIIEYATHSQLKDDGAEENALVARWRENQCGDKECEAVRLEATLLLLSGHETDHRYYARVVTVGKQEIENRATGGERCAENHVFTCVRCSRQWTVVSNDQLECFFSGLCYWCLCETRTTQDEVKAALVTTAQWLDVKWRRPNIAEILECHGLTPEELAFRIRGVIRMCGSVELLALTPCVFPAPRPTIICLCGSTRFVQTWIDEYQRLSDEGNIVLTVARMPPRPNLQHDEPELKRRLDELHLRKIDLADEVFVLDVDRYIGSSTKREIEYAITKGKPVRYLSNGHSQCEHGVAWAMECLSCGPSDYVAASTPAPVPAEAAAQDVPWSQWSISDMIETLEQAMQLSVEVPCDCDRGEFNLCAEQCLGSRIWKLIHPVRKRLRMLSESTATTSGAVEAVTNYIHLPQYPMNGTQLECDGSELRPDGTCAKCERINDRIEAHYGKLRDALNEVEVALISIADGVNPAQAVTKAFCIINDVRLPPTEAAIPAEEAQDVWDTVLRIVDEAGDEWATRGRNRKSETYSAYAIAALDLRSRFIAVLEALKQKDRRDD